MTECRVFGWYEREVPGLGWQPCEKGEPGARESLNRLHSDARWDFELYMYIREKAEPPRYKLNDIRFTLQDDFQLVLSASGTNGEARNVWLADARGPNEAIRVSIHAALNRLEVEGWRITDEEYVTAHEAFLDFYDRFCSLRLLRFDD